MFSDFPASVSAYINCVREPGAGEEVVPDHVSGAEAADRRLSGTVLLSLSLTTATMVFW